MVYASSLENCRACKRSRGFESHPILQQRGDACLQAGDRVQKIKDYRWPGIEVAGALHIYSGDQLERTVG